MNTYFSLIQTLKTIFEQDVNVSTITTQDDHKIIDNYKKNVYPLVHLNILSSPFIGTQNTAVVRYDIEVNVLDIRDINKEEVNDKFWLNDNRHENLDTTRAILKLGLNKMVKDTLDTDITVDSATAAEPVIYAFSNLLDGWKQTWTIDVPDFITTVCNDLVIIGYEPNASTNVIAGEDLPILEFWFNNDITLQTGTLELKYEGGFFGNFDETDMTVSGNKLTVAINKLGIPAGDYYSLISEGLVTSAYGDNAAVTSTTELAFTAPPL